MRNDVSRLKYLAFVVALGACFFDPKAVGPGKQSGSQLMDGGQAGNDGTAGTRNAAGSGRGGNSGSGTGAVSGANASGTGASGVGGMSATGGTNPPPPPPLLANGAECTDDARCTSGHCDGVCCDKGAECCTTVADCTTQTGGLGMSCDDRASCRGSSGKITCTAEHKCVTMNGVRNDSACTNRVEANDCGLYPSVFCLGGEVQSGAPACATSCTSDNECDPEAHCDAGKCVLDLGNGEPCKRGPDCTQGSCRNIKNGVGVCCGALADCCKAPTDCPDTYHQAAICNTMTCSGTELVAQCNGNICNSTTIINDAACAGMMGPNCGLFKDIVCMPGRNNQCKTSCSNMGDCDENAFCDSGRCVAKRANGGDCTMANQCMSGNCMNSVCCSANGECCKTVDQCTKLDPKCDDNVACKGTRRMATCQNSLCSYSSDRVSDDRACTTGGNGCGNFRDVSCNGKETQDIVCLTVCSNAATDCDRGFVCSADGRACLSPGSTSGTGGMSGSSGSAPQ
jgi:hypothetical protein